MYNSFSQGDSSVVISECHLGDLCNSWLRKYLRTVECLLSSHPAAKLGEHLYRSPRLFTRCLLVSSHTTTSVSRLMYTVTQNLSISKLQCRHFLILMTATSGFMKDYTMNVLRRGSAAARLLEMRVRIPLGV